MKKELKWNSEIKWMIVLLLVTFLSAYAIKISSHSSIVHGLSAGSGKDWGALILFISIPVMFYCIIMFMIGLFKKSKYEIAKHRGKWKWYAFSLSIFCFALYSVFQLLMIFNLSDDFRYIDIQRDSWRLFLFIPSLWITAKGIKYRLS